MATIFSEDFEGATQGPGQGTLGAFGFIGGTTQSFTDGAGDFLTVTDGAGEFGSFVQYTGASGQFLAGMDLNGEGATLPIVIEAGGIDISGFTDLGLSLSAAEDDDGTNQDWDIADFVHVSVRIDGGAFVDVLNFESIPDGDAFNAVPALDAGFDGDGDVGRELTDAFATFSSAIAGSGSTLDLRITLNLDSGDEDIALDDFLLTGTPGDDVPPPLAPVRISEFQPNPTGADPATQIVELSGAPGAAFSGWLLGIESDGANGTVDRAAQVCLMYVAQQGVRTAYCALSFFDADGTFLEQGLFGEVTLKRVRLDGTPYRLALETIRARDDTGMATCEGTFTR